MKKALCIETAYLPPVQYWNKWLERPLVYIEACEHYVKGSYRNRCYLAGSHGPLCLSIPLLKGKNEGQPIREVRIDKSRPWHKQHWQSIQSCYGKAPFFEHYAAELEAFYQNPPDFLFDWNMQLLNWMQRQLGLEAIQLKHTTSYARQLPKEIDDWRYAISPKAHRAGPDPDFTPRPYPQLFEDRLGFLPGLSALDLLLCMGPESQHYLR